MWVFNEIFVWIKHKSSNKEFGSIEQTVFCPYNKGIICLNQTNILLKTYKIFVQVIFFVTKFDINKYFVEITKILVSIIVCLSTFVWFKTKFCLHYIFFYLQFYLFRSREKHIYTEKMIIRVKEIQFWIRPIKYFFGQKNCFSKILFYLPILSRNM